MIQLCAVDAFQPIAIVMQLCYNLSNKSLPQIPKIRWINKCVS